MPTTRTGAPLAPRALAGARPCELIERNPSQNYTLVLGTPSLYQDIWVQRRKRARYWVRQGWDLQAETPTTIILGTANEGSEITLEIVLAPVEKED